MNYPSLPRQFLGKKSVFPYLFVYLRAIKEQMNIDLQEKQWLYTSWLKERTDRRESN